MVRDRYTAELIGLDRHLVELGRHMTGQLMMTTCTSMFPAHRRFNLNQSQSSRDFRGKRVDLHTYLEADQESRDRARKRRMCRILSDGPAAGSARDMLENLLYIARET